MENEFPRKLLYGNSRQTKIEGKVGHTYRFYMAPKLVEFILTGFQIPTGGDRRSCGCDLSVNVHLPFLGFKYTVYNQERIYVD